jgi:hypothetical protein
VNRRELLMRILYWIAVLVVSLAILVGLIMLLESRDSSEVGRGGPTSAAIR